MEEKSKQIKKHWDRIGGARYDSYWRVSSAREKLSEKELNFTKSFISREKIKALDYGSGSGRFLELILESSAGGSVVFGKDISEEMASYCRKKFLLNPKFGGMEPPPAEKFDFITAIRMLKYNRDWKEIIVSLMGKLDSGGIIIFTVPNKYSTSGLYFRKSPHIKKSIREIEQIVVGNGLEILDRQGFARLPDFLYGLRLISQATLLIESVLEKTVGNRFLAREIFYACRKK